MATKAKSKKAKAKPILKEQTPPKGKYKARTAGYEFTIKENGHTLIHRLGAMSDVALLNWQRGTMAANGLSGDLASVATIEVWTQAWLSIIQGVDGYNGIEDGAPFIPERTGLIPFYHINHVMTRVFESIGVIAGDEQKN